MKYYFLTLILVAVTVAGTSCDQVDSAQTPQTNTEPMAVKNDEPLILDDEPLLLLDDSPESGEATGPVADNSRCHVCHLNYIQEDIAVIHARANIGCADCHGNCDEHIADESWASGGNGTPPGIMYPLSKINPFCMGCHTKETMGAELHKPLFSGTAKQKYCTDCHGNHRLAQRNCKWK